MKKFIIILMIGLFFISSTLFANENYSSFDENLEYEYSFIKKYVVAGERVLNLDFINNSDYDIDA
ncbi:MAG: hypothetical protein ACOCP8_08545 [archaeon]